jgi:arylsulfatase A-like enzyme
VTANVNGIIAIRSGEWKWIEGVLPAGFQGTFSAEEARSQLYNLRDDPAETHNLSRQRPEIVERLRRELQAIRQSD